MKSIQKGKKFKGQGRGEKGAGATGCNKEGSCFHLSSGD